MRADVVFLAVIAVPFALLATDIDESSPLESEPWFTGPLLAPTAEVIPVGHFNLEPYIFATANTAVYNKEWHSQKIPTLWVINPLCLVQAGITSWLDFQFIPSFQYAHRSGAAAWELQDWTFQLDAQLIAQSSWFPSIRFSVIETIPLGNYRNLNPKKLRTDQSGFGSWATDFQLVFAQLYHIRGHYFMNWRLALTGSIPAPVHVKGFNTYGGGYGTNGTTYPGKEFSWDFAIEINLSRNWTFACDVVGSWVFSGRFRGNPGQSVFGTPATNVLPPSVVYSVAPAIEYNWNESIGLIAGWWGSFAGKNSNKFSSFVIAFNYYK